MALRRNPTTGGVRTNRSPGNACPHARLQNPQHSIQSHSNALGGRDCCARQAQQAGPEQREIPHGIFTARNRRSRIPLRSVAPPETRHAPDGTPPPPRRLEASDITKPRLRKTKTEGRQLIMSHTDSNRLMWGLGHTGGKKTTPAFTNYDVSRSSCQTSLNTPRIATRKASPGNLVGRSQRHALPACRFFLLAWLAVENLQAGFRGNVRREKRTGRERTTLEIRSRQDAGRTFHSLPRGRGRDTTAPHDSDHAPTDGTRGWDQDRAASSESTNGTTGKDRIPSYFSKLKIKVKYDSWI